MAHAPTPLSAGPGLVIDDLLQLPRPSSAIVSPTRTHALWPSSTFSFSAADGKGRTDKSVYLVSNLDDPALPPADATATTSSDSVTTNRSPAPRKLLSSLAYLEFTWLDSRTFLFLRPSLPTEVVAAKDERGRRVDHPLNVSDAEHAKRRSAHAALEGGQGVELWAFDVLTEEEYQVGSFPVVISNLTLVDTSTKAEESVVLAFSAKVFPDGSIYNVAVNKDKAEEAKRGSDARVYDTLFIRHWDEWTPTTGEKTQLHFVKLTRNPDSLGRPHTDEDGFEHVEKPSDEKKWRLVLEQSSEDAAATTTRKASVQSPLAGLNLECPVGPFGGADDFDLSRTHLVFHSKDPHVNPAWHTRTQVYLIPLSPRSAPDATPRQLTVGTQGASSSPVFSPDGSKVAWLEMKKDGYEADRNRVVVYTIESGERQVVTEKWDRSPKSVKWSEDGEGLLLVAEDRGYVKLFSLPLPASSSVSEVEPTALTHDGTITSFTSLTSSRLLLTINSLTSPNELALLTIKKTDSKDQPDDTTLEPIASLTGHLKEVKTIEAPESFWFAGAGGVQIHGFIAFPPGFSDASIRKKKGKKFPLAFLVHGGPQGAWTDSWSTRWNPAIYAAHGYITVTINPTGSTGYGQELTDRIQGNWGGAPFEDLVAGLEFLKEAYPEIDGNRTAMLGASYGGFMANWIQGHNERMGFQAIVCHDGVFSTPNVWYTTEELYFPEQDFGGEPFRVPENYSKWNPQNHIHKWRTPQLVIHGGKDYRLLEGEGIGVFNTLQRLNVPSRFLYFESENHWVLSAANGRKWHEEVLKWIDEWTAPEEDDVVAKKDEKDEQETTKEGLTKSGYQVAYKSS